MNTIQASIKYARISPRKMVQIAKVVKTLSPLQAIGILGYLHKNGAREMQNIIKSAISNAHNQNIDVETLKFKEIIITPGTAMKRFQAVSRGMAHEYKKRMSHIRVVLTNNMSEGKGNKVPKNTASPISANNQKKSNPVKKVIQKKT